ncbi:M81 family metallopeptidase [Elioraea sp.]|uniref:M81 family metallopeptidase n=1 Tax=Elioraea sp. TaxID=2185103 RepID=UPI0021DE685D|nr:M81 family metallopeptidase [Elioraea sp.]GIX09929.1 MAG: microcystinase C [Elioraea sp.]
MRIAIAGLLHESHSFAPFPADLAAFEKPGGFPPLTRGAAMLEAIAGTRVPAAGARELVESEGHTVVPLAWGIAMPSAPVTRDAFETIAGWIVEDAAAAMPLDGLYLDLHGAMMVEGAPDGEGELLARLRARLGPALPIAASLDLHANVTRAMVAHADVLTAYRTYPHVDMKETGARAMRLLLDRIAHGRPWARRHRPIDFLVPLSAQCTLAHPMRDLYEAIPLVAQQAGAADLSLCLGFPYCDFEGCGPAVTAYAATETAAEAAAARLHDMVVAHRAEMVQRLWTPEAAVRHAKARASLGGPPIVLADTQDNPGGGGHGDTTGLLRALVEGGAAGAVVGVLNDAATAAAAHAAGEGAAIEVALGGRSDGAPLHARFVVQRLGDGRFTCTGPMTRGNRADLGPCALLETGGVHVLVASRKMQAYDQAMFRHLGIEPATVPIIALKSSVHFRADFQPIAREILIVAAPGPVVADPSALPFRNLRPGLALSP